MQKNIVSIHQPNFFPWTGYFNKIVNSDNFILFDDVQFERGKTYTSRTKVLCQGKEKWLTVPVIGKGEMLPINQVTFDNSQEWKTKHLSTIMNYYRKSPCYKKVFSMIEEIYSHTFNTIGDFNIFTIKYILNYLESETLCFVASELTPHSKLSGLDRIVELLESVKATDYLSGSGAGSKRYMEEARLNEKSIHLMWQEYEAKSYFQKNVEHFIPNLSIIDLLFSKGKDSIKLLL
ncbi:MAG: WbqC family protein [Pleomorphochaeta sp.]